MAETSCKRDRDETDETCIEISKRVCLNSDHIQVWRADLPTFKCKNLIMETIKRDKVVILVGETGSGKSTQVPQFLLDEGICETIVCTQPTREATIRLATRVAFERDKELGTEVGYITRFQDRTDVSTKITFMTDGRLLREAVNDPLLLRFSCFVLDEAHERTVNTDILFGIVKQLACRKDIKIVIMSATLDDQKERLCTFFGCSAVNIPGRLYDVAISHLKDNEHAMNRDYLSAAVDAAIRIHEQEPPGDVLIFLTGKDEILTACERIQDRLKRAKLAPACCLPFYASLPDKQLQAIFEPPPKGPDGLPLRRFVVATNVAETSLTLEGVAYVVDCGRSKQASHDPCSRVDFLVNTFIAQPNAKQRAGRAGRTRPGKCWRLYCEGDLPASAVPAIRRSNLTHVVLMLRKMGVVDPAGFDFIEPPPPGSLVQAINLLRTLGAIHADDSLTEEGSLMADLPVDPQLGRMLVESARLGCVNDAISIASLLSVTTNIFAWPVPRNAWQSAMAAKRAFARRHGQLSDHLTVLEAYKGWRRYNTDERWARDNYLDPRGLVEADMIRRQLAPMMQIWRRFDEDLESQSSEYFKLRRAIFEGFFNQAAYWHHPEEGYRTMKEDMLVKLHPSTSFARTSCPQWIVFHECTQTKTMDRQCSQKLTKWNTAVDESFLLDKMDSDFRPELLAESRFKRSLMDLREQAFRQGLISASALHNGSSKSPIVIL